MKQPDHQWLDLINKIDNLGEDYRQNLQIADQIRRKKYNSLIREDCQKHQRNRMQRQIRKLKEREMVDRAVEQDKKIMQERQRSHMQYEKQFGVDNRLLFKHKRHKTQQAPVPEHPFIRLVDGQQRRNAIIRNHFRQQNEINQMQEIIKREQHNRQRQLEQEARRNYQDYVESIFKKREVQNCQNRLKYAWNKHNSTERGEDPESEERRLHKQYLGQLQQQIKDQNRKKRSRTDNSMNKFEDQVNHSPQLVKYSASPAFLGKIPYSHDRKRQIEIINKKLGLDEQRLKHQTNQKVKQLNHLPNINRFKQLRNIIAARDSIVRQVERSSSNHLEAKPQQPKNSMDVSPKNNPDSSPVRSSKQVLSVQTRTTNITPVPRVQPITTHPKSIRTFKKYDLLSGQYSTINIMI